MPAAPPPPRVATRLAIAVGEDAARARQAVAAVAARTAADTVQLGECGLRRYFLCFFGSTRAVVVVVGVQSRVAVGCHMVADFVAMEALWRNGNRRTWGGGGGVDRRRGVGVRVWSPVDVNKHKETHAQPQTTRTVFWIVGNNCTVGTASIPETNRAPPPPPGGNLMCSIVEVALNMPCKAYGQLQSWRSLNLRPFALAPLTTAVLVYSCIFQRQLIQIVVPQ